MSRFNWSDERGNSRFICLLVVTKRRFRLPQTLYKYFNGLLRTVSLHWAWLQLWRALRRCWNVWENNDALCLCKCRMCARMWSRHSVTLMDSWILFVITKLELTQKIHHADLLLCMNFKLCNETFVIILQIQLHRFRSNYFIFHSQQNANEIQSTVKNVQSVVVRCF